MQAIRKITKNDTERSTLLRDIGVQLHCAEQAGEISPEFRADAITIINRMHTKLVLKTGILDRMRQARYDRRNPNYIPRITHAVIAFIVIICVFTIAN